MVGLTIFAIATDVRMREPALAATQAVLPRAPAGPIQKLQVAKVFQTECAACHDVDGSGNVIRQSMPTLPDFSSLGWQMTQTDLEITHRIQDGDEPLMPAYKDKLTRDEILALTIYIRAFSVMPTTTPGPTLAQTTPIPEPETKQATTRPGEIQPSATAKLTKAGPGLGTTRPAPKLESSRPEPIVARIAVDRLYGAHCKGCHDVDGRGDLVRKTMPETPDFTDASWERSRTDAELLHSILEGKGKFMRPAKDKLGPTDAQRLVAFVRSFQKPEGSVTPEPVRPAANSPPVRPEADTQQLRPTAPGAPPQPASAPAPTNRVVEPPSSLSPSLATVAKRTRVATVRYREYCLSCHGIDGRGAEMKAAMPTIPDFTVGPWQGSKDRAELALSILDGKGTLMPAFRDRVSEDDAQNLVAYIRAFGPRQTRPVQSAALASEFEARFRQLEGQWDELERQLRDLPPRRILP
jgi:mono/diheme cytochrome c family protein